jgi:proline racemase
MRIARSISAVDTHVCGEPGRVIVGGVLDVPGNSIFEKKSYLEEHADHLRKMMLREPRGYPASNCNLILPACHPDADAGFVIMEQVVVVKHQWDTRNNTHISLKNKHLRFWSCSWYFSPQNAIILPLN